MSKEVLYFYVSKASFVEKDLSILRSEYKVEEFLFPTTKKVIIPYYFIKQIFTILKYYIFRKKIIMISQFAGYHSFIPSLFSSITYLKHIVVLGGTECNYLPSINYGNHRIKLLNYCTKISLQFATQLWPVCQELVECDYSFDDDVPAKQGYKSIYPEVQTKSVVIHNGVDPTLFKIHTKTPRRLSFISIAAGLSNTYRCQVKGIDLIINIASEFPNYDFYIIGDKIDISIPSNVKILPFLNNDELPNILSQFSHYLQLSMTEGFPNALLEAMLCGCIPIVSNVSIMPEIVSNFGYVLHKRDSDKLKSVINEAISKHQNINPNKIREYVIEKYHINLRNEKILNTLKTLQ